MAEDKKLQKKLAKFEEEIMNLARTECSTIEAETQSNLESQRASLKAAADAEAAKYFEAELREIDGQFRAAAFSEKDRLRKELFSIREKYMSNVFDLAADRLREFAAGSEYADFLCAKAREAAMQANFAGGTLYLRQEDLSYADALTAVASDRSSPFTNFRRPKSSSICISLDVASSMPWETLLAMVVSMDLIPQIPKARRAQIAVFRSSFL